MLKSNFKNTSHRILVCLILIEFFQMQFVPTTYNSLKMLFLIPIMLICTLTLVSKRYIVLTSCTKLIILYAFSNLLFIFYGVAVGNPGAIKVATVDVVYPILYLILGQVFPTKDNLHGFIKVIFWFTFVIAIYDILFLFANALGLSALIDNVFLKIDAGMRAGMAGGIVNYSSYHTEIYVFNLPFLMALTYKIDQYIEDGDVPSKAIYYVGLIVMSMVSLLSSSRALVVCIVFAFIFIRILAILHKHLTSHGIILGLIILSIVIIGIALNSQKLSPFFSELIRSIIQGFSNKNVSFGSSEYLRSTQKSVLLSGWLNNPIVGAGAGACANDIIRNPDQPWSYEMTYYALLFQKGIIGFCIFGIIVIYTLLSLWKLRKHFWITFPTFVGYLCFLAGNAINPYMQKFSFIWIFFFPMMIVDCIKKNEYEK